MGERIDTDFKDTVLCINDSNYIKFFGISHKIEFLWNWITFNIRYMTQYFTLFYTAQVRRYLPINFSLTSQNYTFILYIDYRRA